MSTSGLLLLAHDSVLQGNGSCIQRRAVDGPENIGVRSQWSGALGIAD